MNEYLSRKPSWVGDALAVWDKQIRFMNNDFFLKALNQSLTSPLEQTRFWRVHTLCWAAHNALRLPGDFMELGTFRGFYAKAISTFTDFDCEKRSFYLFDTFNGFDLEYSKPEDFQGGEPWMAQAQAEYSQPDVYDSVISKFRSSNYKIIKGSIFDTLEDHLPEKIAFLSVDLNSPKAESFALSILWERVEFGGYIILDDYGWNNMQKQSEIHDDFFQSKNQMILELPTGQGLVIKS